MKAKVFKRGNVVYVKLSQEDYDNLINKVNMLERAVKDFPTKDLLNPLTAPIWLAYKYIWDRYKDSALVSLANVRNILERRKDTRTFSKSELSSILSSIQDIQKASSRIFNLNWGGLEPSINYISSLIKHISNIVMNLIEATEGITKSLKLALPALILGATGAILLFAFRAAKGVKLGFKTPFGKAEL